MNVNIQDVVLVIGVILTVLNIIERVILFKDKAKQPHLQHEQRIVALESEVKHIEDKLNDDGERIAELEMGTRVLMKSIGALLSHGIDGNNTDEMKLAREELNDYLISR